MRSGFPLKVFPHALHISGLSAGQSASWLVRLALCWKLGLHTYTPGLSPIGIAWKVPGLGLRPKLLSKSPQSNSFSPRGLQRGTATGVRHPSGQRGCACLLSGAPHALPSAPSQGSPSPGPWEALLELFSDISACDSKSSGSSSFWRNTLPSVLVSQSEMTNTVTWRERGRYTERSLGVWDPLGVVVPNLLRGLQLSESAFCLPALSDRKSVV